MAENVRPPVAVRIVRPYQTEDEFLQNELETVGKTSVILIGAHPRPTGVILRFEVTLASGGTVLRGEGRVLSHKENAFRGQPGLSLRFTRLDPKSKALVDRAAAIREARISGASEPPRVQPPPAQPTQPTQPERPSRPTRSARPAPVRSDPAIAQALAATPEPPPAAPPAPEPPPPPPPPPPEPPVVAAPPEPPAAPTEPPPPPPPPEPAAAAPPEAAQTVKTKPFELTPPPVPVAAVAAAPVTDRDALLARLRTRAASLSPERIQEIMALRR